MKQAHVGICSSLLLVASLFCSHAARADLSSEKIRLDAPSPEEMRERVAPSEEKSVSNGLVLSGTGTYAYVGSSGSLGVDFIQNNSFSRTTGSLRLDVWATSTPTTRGGGVSGYKLMSGPVMSQLLPRTQYSNVLQTATFLFPPNGIYYITLVLAEYDPSSNCASDGYCVSDSIPFTNTATFGPTTPPPSYRSGISTNSLGARGTVTASATMYGGFELGARSQVFILVRGNSLGSLGVTQNYLDAPRVRLYNQQGTDLVSQGGLNGFNDCVSTNTATDLPIINYYAQTRGAPVSSRDSCYATTLNAGAYTFTVTPSINGVTSNSEISAPSSGEVLFEVLFLN
jgi:hypothetical protein